MYLYFFVHKIHLHLLLVVPDLDIKFIKSSHFKNCSTYLSLFKIYKNDGYDREGRKLRMTKA